jgi:hypothetical protein
MMGRKSKLKGGAEYDLLYARKWYCYLARAGVAHKLKKIINRRERRASKMEDKEE